MSDDHEPREVPPAREFQDLLERVRGGDAVAAAALVNRFEPMIRRIIRVRLAHDGIRRHFDTMDVSQSVLATFFVRAGLGQYEIDSPESLMKLLTQIARNKLTDKVRRARSSRRDYRRENPLDGAVPIDPADSLTPDRIVEARDLLSEVRKQLSHEAQRVAEWRAEGLEWAEIGERLGVGAEAIRKRFSRELDEVVERLESRIEAD